MNLQRPLGKQADFIKGTNARLNIADGSIRAGKTVGSLWRWLYYVAKEAPPGTLVMWGKTERTLKENILIPLAEMVGQDLRVVSGSGEAFLWGRRIALVGANDARAETKVRGRTIAGAYADELTLTPEEFWLMVLRGMDHPDAKLFGTTNPDAPKHWLKAKVLDRPEALDLAHFHFTLDDNPVLAPEIVANLKAEFGPGTLFYRRFIDGEWVIAEGAVYDFWDETAFVVDALPDGCEVIKTWIANDYGTTDPFVLLKFCWVKERDGYDRIYVVDEFRYDSAAHGGRTRADVAYSADLKAFIDGDTIDRIVIPRDAASFFAQLVGDGYRPMAARMSVKDGIRTVASLLVAGRLKVLRRCTGTIEEIPGYVWDAKAQERGEDKPAHDNSHGPDTLRYGIYNSFDIWRAWIAA